MRAAFLSVVELCAEGWAALSVFACGPSVPDVDGCAGVSDVGCGSLGGTTAAMGAVGA